MKRVFALLLCFAFLFGLCACRSAELPEQGSLGSEKVTDPSDSGSAVSSVASGDGATDVFDATESEFFVSSATTSSSMSDVPSQPSSAETDRTEDLPAPEPVPEPKPEPEPVDELVSYTENKAAVDAVLSASEHLVGICDQKNGRILVCDLAESDWSDDNAVVWEYLHYGKKQAIHIDGLKFRDSAYYGEKVLIYCFPHGVRIVSYQTKQVLWEVNGTDKVGTNIHSVELLPDGTVITASSTDSLIHVFAPGETAPCQTLSLPNAHGVLWDPTYNVLWGIGRNLLRAYTYSVSSGKPQIERKCSYFSPQAGMHDLAADSGNADRLLFTCSAGVMVFDKKTESMSYSYSGGLVGKTKGYVSGCGLFADGVFVFTAVETGKTVYRDWCTNYVQYYVPINAHQGCLIERTVSGDAYYKLRIVDFNYQ